MWPFWLREAIEAAIVANETGDEIPPRYEQFKQGQATDEDLDELVIREMIATMRAIGGAAFAIDALYAAVKARSPEHPHQATWREKGAARHKQVTETFFYHLKIKNQTTKKAIRHWVSQIYKFRDWAVHSPSEFAPAQYRADLEVGLDQCFNRFRRENAIMATAMAVCLFDYLGRSCRAAVRNLPSRSKAHAERWIFCSTNTKPQGCFLPSRVASHQRQTPHREPPRTSRACASAQLCSWRHDRLCPCPTAPWRRTSRALPSVPWSPLVAPLCWWGSRGGEAGL
jgi:hypothetical protein